MRKILIPCVVTAFVAAAMAYQAKTVTPVLAEAPSVSLEELPGYVSEAVPVSEAELRVLPGDTRFVKRMYTGENGVTHNVSVVIGGASKSSVHRPEMCLPAQGFQMVDPRDITVGGVDWHVVTLTHGAAAPSRFAYTFFNQEGFRTSSHVKRIFRDVWDRSILCRIDRWVMVTVHSTVGDDDALAAFLKLQKAVTR